ncbi:hypothetical protein ABFS83_07G018400 [Erythranthe nasuta]
MEKNQENKFTILMFPWLAHGHINPFLELAKRLSKTRNFNIHLCSTPVNLDSTKTNIENDDESIKLVNLHMPNLPQLPPQLHTTKNLPSDLLPTLMHAFQDSSSSFSDIMDSVEPDLLIYDFFQPWAPKLASSRGIPCVYFSIFGAAPFSYYHHIYSMGTGSTFPYKALCIPDEEIVKLRNKIAPNIKDANNNKDFAFGNFSMSSEIVLVKCCREIEEKYIHYLSFLCKKKIVPTGPLLACTNDCNNDDDDEIMKWLSGKSRGSTIYISFGSEIFLSKEQIAEIAKGLQLCCVSFIWVVRSPVGAKETNIEDEGEWPVGFLEMANERGILVNKWAPQGKILRHPSIGGFVSHCGWSSVMESLYYGVPIIAMPMRAEQPINAQLVVEGGVGVEVDKGGGENGEYVGVEMAKAVNKVISEGDFGDGLRERAKRMGEKMKEKEDEEMNVVADELLRICCMKKIKNQE